MKFKAFVVDVYIPKEVDGSEGEVVQGKVSVLVFRGMNPTDKDIKCYIRYPVVGLSEDLKGAKVELEFDLEPARKDQTPYLKLVSINEAP